MCELFLKFSNRPCFTSLIERFHVVNIPYHPRDLPEAYYAVGVPISHGIRVFTNQVEPRLDFIIRLNISNPLQMVVSAAFNKVFLYRVQITPRCPRRTNLLIFEKLRGQFPNIFSR
jgi:hypothetical protein